MNALVDAKTIRALYKASGEGVKIDLISRDNPLLTGTPVFIANHAEENELSN